MLAENTYHSVSFSDAHNYCVSNGFTYHECSSNTNSGVSSLFLDVGRSL